MAEKQTAEIATLNRAFAIASHLSPTGIEILVPLSILVTAATLIYVFAIMPTRAVWRAMCKFVCGDPLRF